MKDNYGININDFIKDYPSTYTKDLIYKYGINKKQISYLQGKYKLFKTNFRVNNISKEYIINIAKTYTSFNQFRMKNYKLYNIIIKENWIKDIKNLFIPISYSTPQLILQYIMDKALKIKSSYNNRSIIKPYEIDVYYDKHRIGFEYNSIIYHKNKKDIDLLKSILCKEKNILLIHINETSRKYEADIKTQIINNLELINSQCDCFLTEKNINSITVDYNQLIINKDTIKNICNKYDDYLEFRKKEKSIYSKLERLKLLDVYCKHMKKRRKKYTNEYVINELKKYKTLNELIKNDVNLYNYCNNNNKSLLEKLPKKNKQYSLNEIKLTINKYKFLKDFRENENALYNYIIQKKIKYLLFNLKKLKQDDNYSFSDEYINKIISNYNEFKKFRNENKILYNWIYNNNKLHMLDNLDRYRRKNINLNDLTKIIKKYTYLKDFITDYPKDYQYLRKYNKELLKNLKKYKRK